MSDVSSVPSRPQSPLAVPNNHLPAPRPYRFTWDPASRRPGPESVSGTTEGRGGDDFAGLPHPSLGGLFNNSTASLALASLPTEWSSSRTGFHAISTVLNNPHKRQAPPKAHSSLPGVAAADLPRVRRKDFESYLHAIAPEWERYEHNLQLGQEGELDANLSTPRNSIGGRGPPTTPRQSNQLDSQRGKYIPSLDSVPAIFFEKSFNLGDPRTFAIVTEQDAAAALLTPHDDSFADPFSLSHALPLLEKFSHYADTVEQHLVREISLRSTSFFAALTNLHDLQTESEHCLDRISKLRTQLQDVDKNSARGGLEMVRKECKMDNLSRVRDGVRMISGVVEMTGVAKGLVSAGQWGEALDIIEEIDKLWQVEEHVPESAAVERPRISGLTSGLLNGNGDVRGSSLSPTLEEPSEAQQADVTQSKKRLSHQHPIALSSLYSFSALPSHLRVLTMEIAASLSSELVSILRSDLELRINGDGKADADADQGLKDRLKPLLLNLVRTKGLKEGMLSWREVVLIEVRGVVTKILPIFESDEDENGSREVTHSEARPGLANHLRNMQHSDFVLLIQKVYKGLLNGVEGLHAQGNMIVEVLESLKGHLRQKIKDIPALQEDLADIVSSSAEFSNTQAAKVISYRAEQHAALELADFLIFFNDSWAFVVRCEVLCRRMIVGLRGTVLGQAKLFLQTFHQIRISRSAKLVEDELWNPTEVTPGLQHITNLLVDSAVRDPPDLIIKSDDTIFSPVIASFPSPAPTTSNGTSAIAQTFSKALSKLSPSNGSNAPMTTLTSSKHLHIEDRTYYAVSATTEVLTLLMDYLRVVVNMSMLTTDAMSRVIEFLKSFNSRTCQVVLGAGAMRSAGLKNITAKHLALASQSLSIIFELIPYVRETFRRHLSQNQAVMLVEFDKLKRDYQEHQNEIHSKLVAIMGDRLNSHIKALQNVDWTAPKPGGGVNEYMEILVKETATLHKVLSRYLAPSIVEYVMTQVFAAINHRLSEEYSAINLPDQEAKARLLADAKYLQQKLSVLKNVGTSTSMLETVIAEKNLHRGNATTGPSTPTRSNTLSANQRLKGLLSGKSSSFDKTMPIPASMASPPPVPPSADKPRSPALNNVRHRNMDHDRSTNESQISLGLSLSPPIQKPATLLDEGESGAGAGFKQVELSSSNAHLEALHLRELKGMGASSTGSGGPPPLLSTILQDDPMKPKDK